MDLIGTRGTTGIWNVNTADGFGAVPAFNLGSQGTPNGNDLVNLQVGQIPGLPNSVITTNPVVPIWRGLWVPQSYAARSVSFTPAANNMAGTHWLGLIFELTQSQTAAVYVGPINQIVTGTGFFPISPVPAPSALAVFGLAASAAGRKRRTTR